MDNKNFVEASLNIVVLVILLVVLLSAGVKLWL